MRQRLRWVAVGVAGWVVEMQLLAPVRCLSTHRRLAAGRQALLQGIARWCCACCWHQQSAPDGCCSSSVV